MAYGKNHTTAIGRSLWPHALLGHALIHGGIVGLVTGSGALGFAEVAIHAMTDRAKCAGRFGIHVDQAIHIGCKLVWLIIALHA